MNLREFVNSVGDLTDEALVSKFKACLKQVEALGDDPEALRDLINHEGLLDGFLDLESNDGFGTEGMRL